MVRGAPALLDDRLLIEEILVGLPGRRPVSGFVTTGCWYYRACRAAVAGGGGHLSGPFLNLPEDLQQVAIGTLLSLPDALRLPDQRMVVPVMARVSERHRQLNLLNLEAVAVALVQRSTVWLSARSSAGVLPAVLEAEGVRWKVVDGAL